MPAQRLSICDYPNGECESRYDDGEEQAIMCCIESVCREIVMEGLADQIGSDAVFSNMRFRS